MRNDHHLAIKLRKQKKSYNEISSLLGVPKSTMHYWFKGNAWSNEIKEELIKKTKKKAIKQLKLMAKANRKRYEKQRQQWRKNAIKEFPLIKKESLFLAGLMLYWGEGDSKIENCIVRMSNTDGKMIKIFSQFLQKICKIPKEKIKITLILYPDLSDKNCKMFWNKASNLPISQFRKTQFIYGKHPNKRLPYGVCNIYVSSRELKEKIFIWLKLYQKELLRV